MVSIEALNMQPLDEFYYFAKVVEHGGYAKAARALQIPKSRLSRHVAALEGRTLKGEVVLLFNKPT